MYLQDIQARFRPFLLDMANHILSYKATPIEILQAKTMVPPLRE